MWRSLTGHPFSSAEVDTLREGRDILQDIPDERWVTSSIVGLSSTDPDSDSRYVACALGHVACQKNMDGNYKDLFDIQYSNDPHPDRVSEPKTVLGKLSSRVACDLYGKSERTTDPDIPGVPIWHANDRTAEAMDMIRKAHRQGYIKMSNYDLNMPRGRTLAYLDALINKLDNVHWSESTYKTY